MQAESEGRQGDSLLTFKRGLSLLSKELRGFLLTILKASFFPLDVRPRHVYFAMPAYRFYLHLFGSSFINPQASQASHATVG
jgi:hypothetical protein